MFRVKLGTMNYEYRRNGTMFFGALSVAEPEKAINNSAKHRNDILQAFDWVWRVAHTGPAHTMCLNT